MVCWDFDTQSATVVDTLECAGRPRLRNDKYGYGRINAHRALALAESLATTAVADDSKPILGPGSLAGLRQNYPNPFNPSTEITFELSREGPVSLVIYDVQGRRVRTLAETRLPGGSYSMVWDGTDDSGRRARSGVYFLHLRAGSVHRTVKLLLLE